MIIIYECRVLVYERFRLFKKKNVVLIEESIIVFI